MSAPFRINPGAASHPPEDRPPLWLCVHEAGHAVARLTLDELPPYPGPMLRAVSVIRDDTTLGRMTGQSRVFLFLADMAAAAMAPFPGAIAAQRQHAVYDIVENLAGYVAEHYQRGGPFGPLFLIGGKLIPATLSGELDATEDLRHVREKLAWLAPPDPPAELIRLARITYALITSEWPGIVRAARVLQQHREMDGEAFETAWRAGRSSPATRKRLAARAGAEFADWQDAVQSELRRAAP